jgi:hypothetical protein
VVHSVAPMPRVTRRVAVVWMLSVAASAALAGCKGGSGQPAGDGTTRGGAPSADAKPSGAPAKCAAGATANESPPFCYVVPPGMKRTVDPIKQKGRYQLIYKDGASGSVLSFIAWDQGAFDATWKALQANAAASKATDVKTEDLDGGKAKLLTYTAPGTKGRSIASYLVQGTKQTLECEVDIDKHLPTDKLIELCKQMHEL